MDEPEGEGWKEIEKARKFVSTSVSISRESRTEEKPGAEFAVLCKRDEIFARSALSSLYAYSCVCVCV